jgi:ribosomal protein S18 acetylase RimI-like enzyme
MRISFQPNLQACEFMLEETGVSYHRQPLLDDNWLTVTAYNDHDAVVGVLFCEFKEPFNAHFSCAIADPRCMSRRLLRTIFATLFTRAVRVTALVEPSNDKALKQVKRMGFVLEGFMRLAIEGSRDAMVFGMLRDECRYLPGYRGNQVVNTGGPHGQFTEAA